MHKSLSLKVIGEGANTIKNIKLASGANVLVSLFLVFVIFFTLVILFYVYVYCLFYNHRKASNNFL